MTNNYNQICPEMMALLRHSEDSIFFKDLGGRFVFVSEAKARKSGIRWEDMIGRTDFDFLPQEEARNCRDDQIARSAAIIADKVNEMQSIELSPQERDSFAESAYIIRYDRKPEKDIPISPHQLLEERSYDDKSKDLWTTYNICLENFIKGGLEGTSITINGRRRRVTTRPAKAIDKNIQLNQALWHLTERMAHLKQHAE